MLFEERLKRALGLVLPFEELPVQGGRLFAKLLEGHQVFLGRSERLGETAGVARADRNERGRGRRRRSRDRSVRTGSVSIALGVTMRMRFAVDGRGLGNGGRRGGAWRGRYHVRFCGG